MKFTMREMTLAGAVLVLGLGALTWNVVDRRLVAHRKQAMEQASWPSAVPPSGRKPKAGCARC